MKIFTNEEIRKIERQTLDEEGLTVRDLITRAAEGVAAEVMAIARPGQPMTIFAGPGNNGADALAVAEILIEQGYDPEIFLFNIRGNSLSREARYFRDRLVEGGRARLIEIVDSMEHPVLSPRHIVVDGLFGSGLRGHIDGGYKVLIRDIINDSGATIVSIDIPSGLAPDWNPTTVSRNVVHATLTCAIQYPHPPFFLQDNADIVGRVKVIDIGLSRRAASAIRSQFHLVEADDVKRLLKPRSPFASKADFGHALLVAGSYGMAGAACMAARAALRTGAGKVSVHAPRCVYTVMQTALPEAMFEADKNDIIVTEIPVGKEYQAVALGPGLGRHEQTVLAIENYIKQTRRPLVLDADALNAIARRPQLLKLLPPGSVLTPHAGEFDRLFGEQHSSEARLLKAVEAARNLNVIILLKGRYTAIVRPDGKIYFNSTGNPGMATSGSGDVLTGVIAALMAQGLEAEFAAIAGAFIHGMAGDIAARERGPVGLLATDIINELPQALKTLL